ncbi:MAG: glycosyltransferase family 4 protein [Vicinamibacteria bacterium]
MPEPRILLMAETYHPVLGGGEKHTRSLATGLTRRGFHVEVITRKSSDDLPALEDDQGVIIHRVGPQGTGRGKKFAMVPKALRLARLLARQSDVLMNGGTRVLAIPARLAIAGTRCALVLRPELNGELDGTLALWGRAPREFERALVHNAARLRNSLLQRTGAVVAISEAIAREAIAAGFAGSKVHRIPHGIDMTEYAPASVEEKAAHRRVLGFPLDRTLVVYTGRLIEGKGLETLLSAMKSLADLPFWHLVLVGSGSGQVISIEESLRKEAGTEGLRGRVTFTGRVDNVAQYLQACDVFAFPTLDEALGMSAVEAQACGLPAVASKTGGVPDIVEDKVTGILVPPGEVGALAEGLRSLLTSPELRATMSGAARSRMQERFAFDIMVSRYAELFRSLSKRGGE